MTDAQITVDRDGDHDQRRKRDVGRDEKLVDLQRQPQHTFYSAP